MWWIALYACTQPSTDKSATPGTVPEGTPEREVPRVVINELMIDNESTLERPDGTLPDWFELYNTSSVPVDLATVEVADGDLVWRRGKGVLGAHERLLIYADGAADMDHAPFTLDGDGDTLRVLVDGVETDRVDTGPMPSDVAAIRFPDGEDWRVGVWPTPGYANMAAGLDNVDPRDSLFQKDHVTRLQITLSDEAYAALQQNSGDDDVVAEITFEGIRFPDVHVHLKGSGSYQPITGKAAFKIDLNDLDSGRRMRGLKKLTFNNGVTWDPTWTHEWLSYSLFRAAGIPAPRVGWTRISVNGVDYGLYMNVESYDDELLERWFSDAATGGTLYEGRYDFSSWDNFHLEEGPPRDAWLASVEAALGSGRQPADMEALRRLIDMDEFTTYAACESVTLQWDGYESPNNWRLYVTAGDKGLWLPTGLDYTWSYIQGDPWYGNGQVLQACLRDDECWREFTEKLITVATLANDMDLVGEFDDVTTFLTPEIETDRRTPHSPEETESARVSTRKYLSTWPNRVIREATDTLGE